MEYMIEFLQLMVQLAALSGRKSYNPRYNGIHLLVNSVGSTLTDDHGSSHYMLATRYTSPRRWTNAY